MFIDSSPSINQNRHMGHPTWIDGYYEKFAALDY